MLFRGLLLTLSFALITQLGCDANPNRDVNTGVGTTGTTTTGTTGATTGTGTTGTGMSGTGAATGTGRSQ